MATNPQAVHSQGYEKSDASPRGLFYFVLVMGILLVLASLSLKWLFGYFQRTENPGSFVAQPFAAARPLPPPPRIQPNPGADMESYRESQQHLLNSYEWIDRQNGIVRLPIDRAMELLLQRGLPTRAPGNGENGAPSGKRTTAENNTGRGGSSR